MGVVVGAGVGPFSDGGLDEAFGLAVGARGVGSGEAVAEPELAAYLGELEGAVGWSIVVERGLGADAQPGIPVQRGAQSGDDRASLLVRIIPKVAMREW